MIGDPKPKATKKRKVRKIKNMSSKNTYSDSSGKRWNSAQIERKVNEAKRQFKEQFIEMNDYVFCEDCHAAFHGDGTPPLPGCEFKIDISHEVSVKEAKGSGKVELCWDVNNMRFRGREHHRIHDNS